MAIVCMSCRVEGIRGGHPAGNRFVVVIANIHLDTRHLHITAAYFRLLIRHPV